MGNKKRGSKYCYLFFYFNTSYVTELEDGTFEMITGNTTADVIAWLHKKHIY